MSIASAEALNNRQRFKSHFRTLPTNRNIPFAFAKMVEEFGWNKLMSISQGEDLFTAVHKLTSLFITCYYFDYYSSTML